jgi:hypothetical protein
MSSPYMSGGQPSNYVPPASKNNSALIIVIVLLVVLIGIGAAAAMFLPKMLRARDSRQDAPVASQPAATTPAVSTPAATDQPAVSGPSNQPVSANPAANAVGRYSAPSTSANSSQLVHKSHRVGRGSASDYGAAGQSSQTAADEEGRRQAEQRELDRLAHEASLLDSRMSAVEATIDTMKQGQAEQGVGMRGDIVAAQARLHGNLNRLDAAIQNRDLPAARQYLELCDRDAATLDRFVGH